MFFVNIEPLKCHVVCVWTSLYRRENPSGLCFAGVLIHFRSGKFQALDMSYLSKGHVGFFREFWHDLCQNM